MAGPEIFLSYNREDAAVARLFADAFAREGLEVWWDVTLRSGDAYDQVTEEALRTATAVVVLWSPRSVSSRWVRAEASIADENGTLIPAKIEPCDLPVMFRLTQTADLSHWRGEADDAVWRAFLGDVQRMVSPASRVAAPDPVTAASSTGIGVPQAGVLPFSFRGDDSELEFLAEDLTEDVTRAFAENDYFTVIAAGTMTAWRGKPHDYRTIGRELDTRYLAEGKLQRSGDAIRLTIELIDTESSRAVWSHRFDTLAAEVADNPDRFPQFVAYQLAEQVLQAETKQAMGNPGPYSAWEHVVRSLAFSAGSTAVGPRSIAEARAAVAAAPDYGLAHAVLAGAITSLTTYVGRRLDDALRRELHEHAAKAMQLDGDNPAVLVLLSHAHTALGDGETMLRFARRLVELRPNAPLSHFSLASAYFMLGRTADAIASFDDQLNCKGYNPTLIAAHWCMGWCFLLEGKPLDAEAALEKALTLAPKMYRALQFKAIAEALLGKEKAALATVRRLRDAAPEAPIDQHISYMTQNPRIGRRSGEHIAILRRLWDATEGANSCQ